MKFGPLPTTQAEGALLAHSLKVGNLAFKKGRKLSAQDIAALETAGMTEIIAARLEPDDVPEDDAAAALISALGGPGTKPAAPFTGRANLFAANAGVLLLDRDRLDRLNLLHEALTVATLAPFETVTPGQMLATVKIIPFACPRKILDGALAIAREAAPLIGVRAFRPHTIGLISTRIDGMKESLLDKSRAVLDGRLLPLGQKIAREIRCPHHDQAVAEAVQSLRADGAELILIFGASATVDRRDTVPAGIEQAGGALIHFGMPVDPGNLLLLARHGETPIIGLPGCARSPKLNGFDWVLHRLLAGIPVGPEDIMSMGVGGLLKEIPSRPQPRAGKAITPTPPRIAALVLAAGQSRRMGAQNKLLADIDGKPMIAHIVDTVLRSKAHPVLIVTGHQAAAVEQALDGRDVRFIANPDYADGLSTSLKAGLAALSSNSVDGALMCLGDMPDVSADDLNRLIAAFDPAEDRAICVPTVDGKRGNPVLWSAEFFDDMMALKGDTGAKHLIGEHEAVLCEVPLDGPGALSDIDTPAALAARRRR